MVGHRLGPAPKLLKPWMHAARLEAAIEGVSGHMLVTADHGNVEQMQDPESNQEHTAHTSNLVPLVYVGENALSLRPGGSLCDVAPTLSTLCNSRFRQK